MALMLNKAQIYGAPDLANASETALQSLFQRVGGNPLALKLVVGLNYDLAIPQILGALVQVNVQEVEDLYRLIYRNVWQMISNPAKKLLEIMPLAAEGGMGQAQMLAVSHLEEDQLFKAIQELSRRSLLEVRGTPSKKRYAIHSLTRTFLMSEIIQWFEETP